MSKTIVITGASSGFGAMTARALADAGHTVYAGMRDTTGRNAAGRRRRRELRRRARRRPAHRRARRRPTRRRPTRRSPRSSPRRAASTWSSTTPATWSLGPAEAFTPEQIAAVYDTNVLSTQRVNRAALPHLRAAARRPASSGSARRARAAAPRRTWPRTSRPRRRWTRWPSATPPSCPGSASRPRSSCPAPSPPAPTTSPTPARRPTQAIAAAYETGTPA